MFSALYLCYLRFRFPSNCANVSSIRQVYNQISPSTICHAKASQKNMFIFHHRLCRACLLVLAPLVLLVAALWWWLATVLAILPDPAKALATAPATPSIRITDRKGRLLYEALPDNARYTPLPPERIPACIKNATLAVEDPSFYTNPGFDFRGLARALWQNVRAGKVVSGGSTITQQVARNLLLSPQERGERTLRRKIREAVLAWKLTRELSKDQILALYLNTTYYGGFAYGIEAASQTFFGKTAAQLTLPECALLAGLPQAPAAYDPFIHPEAARERQRVVLDLMVRHGFLTPEGRERALAVPLVYNTTPYPMRAPHFVWMVLQDLHTLQTQGLVPIDTPLEIRTTLDIDIQTLTEKAVQRHLAYLQRVVDHNVNDAAVVVLNAHTGELLALVGSNDYTNNAIHGAVNMATAPRPTGSAFKPIIYAAALQPDHSHPWTEATVLWDVRQTFTTASGAPYRPENYDRREHGPVTLRQALASSLNIPAVTTLQHVGVAKALAYARRLGITTLKDPTSYDLSLALGGGAVSLLQLTNAYIAFATPGVFRPVYWLYEIDEITNNGLPTTYSPPPPQPQTVWDPRVAWLISDILSDDNARSLGFPRHTSLEVGFPAAVKTGTSSGFHDNWAIGYTPDWVVGVWVGNADYKAMRQVDGLTGAAPIWHTIIRSLASAQPPQSFPRPEGIVQETVCSLSGLLPTPACPHTHTAWFITGTQPTQPDNICQQITLDTATGAPAGPETPPSRRQTITAFNLPPIAWDWARAHGWPLVQDFLIGATPSPTPASVFLKSPPDGSIYRLTPDLPTDAQQIPITAETALPGARLRIWADGTLLAECTTPSCTVWWPLSPGEHRFWAVAVTDQTQQQSLVVTITVENAP